MGRSACLLICVVLLGGCARQEQAGPTLASGSGEAVAASATSGTASEDGADTQAAAALSPELEELVEKTVRLRQRIQAEPSRWSEALESEGMTEQELESALFRIASDEAASARYAELCGNEGSARK